MVGQEEAGRIDVWMHRGIAKTNDKGVSDVACYASMRLSSLFMLKFIYEKT
jgi:hypothetical protein